MSNNRNGSAAPASRTVGVRLPGDLLAWIEEKQASFYEDNSVMLPLSTVVRQILVTAKREALAVSAPAPKRKPSR